MPQSLNPFGTGSEARADAKFAQVLGSVEKGFADLRGDLAVSGARIEHMETATRGLKTTIISTGLATGIAIGGLLVALVTYGADQFGKGMTIRESVTTETKTQIEAVEKRIVEKLNALTASQPPKPSEPITPPMPK